MEKNCGNVFCQKLAAADRLLLRLLYPPRCPICDGIVEEDGGICPECRKKVIWVGEPVCKKCGKPLLNQRAEYCHDCGRKRHSFVQGKALWVYEGKARESVCRFKYQNKREYGEAYAREIAGQYGHWIASRGVEAIVPVPLHRKKRRIRGYNQAEILARNLGALLGIPARADLLVRTRNTAPQKTLNDTERKNNLKGAFISTKNVVQLKHILVVDDIYTTGSTVDAVSSVLLDAGAAKIFVCCISIGRGC